MKAMNILREPKIMEITGLTKQISRDQKRMFVFEDLNCDIHQGMKIGLLGQNGAGKSSLMKIIAGLDHDYDGKVIKHFNTTEEKYTYTSNNSSTNELRIGYLEQEPNLSKSNTIFEEVMSGLQYITYLQNRWTSIINEISNDEFCDYNQLSLEQEFIEQRLDFYNGWNIDEDVGNACENLKCPSDIHNRLISTLSGGELRRVALAKLLLSRPDVLLLDEPTNHLDIISVEWLEKFIVSFKGCVMTVTHDRLFLEATSNTIMELDNSKLYIHVGLYSDWLQKRSLITFHTDKKQIKLKNVLQREYNFLRSQEKKSHSNKIKTLEQQIEKDGHVIPFIGYEPRLLIPQGPLLRADQQIFDVENLTYIHPRSEHCFFRNLTFSLRPGMVVGIVGPNGIGKTTLVKLLIGQLQPTHGRIHTSNKVKIGYIDQTRQALNPLNMVWEEILEGYDQRDSIQINERKSIAAREYVKQFNFEGKSQEKYVGFLSGGERNRVHLAKSLRDGSNVLFLDEPSNDLDLDTLRKLEECMETFRGIAVVVSHDRYFLDRVCTHLIAFEKITKKVGGEVVEETKVQWFEGNYSQYLKFKHKQPVSSTA